MATAALQLSGSSWAPRSLLAAVLGVYIDPARLQQLLPLQQNPPGVRPLVIKVLITDIYGASRNRWYAVRFDAGWSLDAAGGALRFSAVCQAHTDAVDPHFTHHSAALVDRKCCGTFCCNLLVTVTARGFNKLKG
jgi:hypothetical protein